MEFILYAILCAVVIFMIGFVLSLVYLCWVVLIEDIEDIEDNKKGDNDHEIQDNHERRSNRY